MTRLPDPDKLPAPRWLCPALAILYAAVLVGIVLAYIAGWRP